MLLIDSIKERSLYSCQGPFRILPSMNARKNYNNNDDDDDD